MKVKDSKLIALIIILLLIIIGAIILYKYESSKMSDFKIEDQSSNIEEAKKYGDEVIGWIRIEGTNISLPLIQRNDIADVNKTTYHFAWTNSFPDDKSNHLTFISHNIRNVSSNPITDDDTMIRFEQLMSFIYEDFTKDNQFIEITDKKGVQSLYRVYAVSLLEEDQNMSYMDTFTKEEQAEYINKAKKSSIYDIDVETDENDMLLTLYTCTRFYGPSSNYSFKVDARKLRENEKQSYASVSKNENYKVIENEMESALENEEEI